MCNLSVKNLVLPSPYALFAEFLGTFVFIFVSCGVLLSGQIFQDIGFVGLGLASGLTFAAMVYATTAISGGHLNPAITLALWFGQRISTVEAIFYVLVQFLAGFAAAFVLFFVFGAKGFEFYLGGPVLSVDTSVQAAVILEAIITGALVFTFFGTIVERQSLQSSSGQDATAGLKRGPVSFGALTLGFVVVAGTILAGSISGGVFNPARAVGPLVTSGHVDSLLIWIVGPATGSLVGFVYPLIFLRQKKKK